MNRIRLMLPALLFGLAMYVPASLLAQPPVPAQEPLERQADVQGPAYSYGRAAVRIGQDYRLDPGDTVREATVIMGNAAIDGRVERDLVVILGKAQIGSTASIGGSVVVIGGSTSVLAGATIRRDLVVIGGAFDAPVGFAPGGEHVVIGSNVLGGTLDAVLPWITRGLLWGRPIVPGLPWVWCIVGLFFLVYLVLNLVFHGPVRVCALTLDEKPLTTFLAGLLVLLLTGPVILLLTLSVVGIAVVPLVSCAAFVALILGRVGVMRWIGMRVVGEDSEESRLQGMRSVVIGFAVVTVAYMVPVLGFATMAIVAVLGLGSATLSFMAGYRRENPLPPPAAPTEHPPTPVSLPGATPLYSSGGAMPLGPDVAADTLGSSSSLPMAAPGAPASTVMESGLALFPHATFLDRLAAFVLDVILVAIAGQMLWPLQRAVGRGADGLFLFLLAYHIGFWTWKSTTVGGIICRLRLTRVDAAPLRFVDALVRGLSSIFSLAVLGIGALWILRDPERQAWHDRIAGTYVVKVPRNWPI